MPTCTKRATHGKPGCEDHLDRLPYPARLIQLVAQREAEEAMEPAKVPLDGIVAGDVLATLRARGPSTVERVAMYAVAREATVRGLLERMGEAGTVRLWRTNRGSLAAELVHVASPAAVEAEPARTTSAPAPAEVVHRPAPAREAVCERCEKVKPIRARGLCGACLWDGLELQAEAGTPRARDPEDDWDGSSLRLWRHRHGVPLRAIAELLGVAQVDLARWEKAARGPRSATTRTAIERLVAGEPPAGLARAKPPAPRRSTPPAPAQPPEPPVAAPAPEVPAAPAPAEPASPAPEEQDADVNMARKLPPPRVRGKWTATKPSELLAWREKHSVSRAAMGAYLKVTGSAIANWENDKSTPPLPMQQRLAKLIAGPPPDAEEGDEEAEDEPEAGAPVAPPPMPVAPPSSPAPAAPRSTSVVGGFLRGLSRFALRAAERMEAGSR